MYVSAAVSTVRDTRRAQDVDRHLFLEAIDGDVFLHTQPLVVGAFLHDIRVTRFTPAADELERQLGNDDPGCSPGLPAR